LPAVQHPALYNMKKIVLFIFTLTIFLGVAAQSSKDTSLEKRLDTYMLLNREARFNELMDFVHPRLFQLAPREQMMELFRKTYDNEYMKLSIDTTAITNISPVFNVNDTAYRRIDYWMGFTVAFKDSETVNAPDFVSKTTDLLKVGFPNSQIKYNNATKSFRLGSSNILIAVRDNDKSPWMFLGHSKNEAFLKTLFPSSVIEYFKLL
jgi:hypothetical protein